MKQLIKYAVKSGLDALGLKVTRVRPLHSYKFSPPPHLEQRWLQDLEIRTVLDVGAHEGESAELFRRLFPAARILSFEPQPQCFAKLEAKLRGRPDHVCFNVALGDSDGTATLFRSSFDSSSSLLKMAERHKTDFPFSSEHTETSVRLARLDDLSSELRIQPATLLKIDTQGFEREVLRGAQRTLASVHVIIVETSFVPLYEGQPLFPEIYALLGGFGFEYAGSWDQIRSPKDGRPLQQDALFVNTRLQADVSL